MSNQTFPSLGEGAALDQCGPGLLAGCKILTLEGYTPIQNLRPGARVITRSGMKRLTGLHISKRRMKSVSVKAGSLGYNRPARDLQMSPEQVVMVRDWRADILHGRDAVLVPIRTLLDETYIYSDHVTRHHDVFELSFDAQEIFYADGVELVSKSPVATTAERGVFEAA